MEANSTDNETVAEGKTLPLSSAYSISDDVNDEDAMFVIKQLAIYNTVVPGYNDFSPLRLLLRDDEGQIKGGLLGWTLWSWLHIDSLWVHEDLRGAGHGARLLYKAEDIAMARGCTLAELDSFNFQAPGFYEKHGYTVFGKLENIAGKFTRFYLRKSLAGQTL